MPEISEQILSLKEIENLNDRVKKLCGKMFKILLTFPSVAGKPFTNVLKQVSICQRDSWFLKIWFFSYK